MKAQNTHQIDTQKLKASWPKHMLLKFPWLNEVEVSPSSAWREKPPSEFPPAHASAYGQDVFGLWYEFTIKDVSQRMRWIPAGMFMMGEENEQHQVMLTQGFWLAETACSQALWQTVMGENPSAFKGDDLPVENVSWHDTQTFLQQLSAEIPYRDFSLPTEAQWEYACRAGSISEYWWGDEIDRFQANFRKSEIEQTVAVNQFAPNPWGLYQMHGNIWEWCSDWYADGLVRSSKDPTGPEEGDERLLRGGGWKDYSSYLRAAYRFKAEPDRRIRSLGFRFSEA